MKWLKRIRKSKTDKSNKQQFDHHIANEIERKIIQDLKEEWELNAKKTNEKAKK